MRAAAEVVREEGAELVRGTGIGVVHFAWRSLGRWDDFVVFE